MLAEDVLVGGPFPECIWRLQKKVENCRRGKKVDQFFNIQTEATRESATTMPEFCARATRTRRSRKS